MKKVFYLLFFSLLSTVTPASIYAQGFAGGDGTEQDPYLITNADQLSLVSNYCGFDHKDEHFRLIKDITLSNPWTTIGSIDNKFTGYFHGGGHKISGLQINDRNVEYAGLFGYSEGTIDSLYIEGTSGKTVRGGQYVGGLVGYNAGDIIYCHATVNVDASSNAAASYSGGLVGYNSGDIQSSSADGDVVALASTNAYAGGLAGYSASNNIVNCFTKGEVNAEAFGEGDAHSGGLVGHLHSGSIANCYTTVTPSANTGNGTAYIGAVIGFNNNADISGCYYNTDNTTAHAVGNNNEIAEGKADGKTTAGMITRDVYIGWDFNEVWGINGSYPYLREHPLRLGALTVKNQGNTITLTPAFHPDTLIYTVDVDNITNVDIAATAASAFSGATITGVGQHTLVTGNNPVTVTIEHHGGKLTYTVNVHKKYTLTFEPRGGTVNPASKDIVSGVNELPVPTRDGYDFTEWNTKPDGDSIAFDDNTIQYASNISVLYAQWKAKKYTLTFDPNEGSVFTKEKTVTYNSVIGELPLPTREGYDFSRWNTLPDGTGTILTQDSIYRIPSDTTLYAQWTAKTVKIHFKSNYPGGTTDKVKDVIYGQPLGAAALPTDFTRTGYSFGEWNTEADGSGEIYDATTIAGNETTLYAQWTAKTYTLGFDTQGGIPAQLDRTVTYDASVGVLPTLDIRLHYTFNGWNTKPDGTGHKYDDDAIYKIDADTTFYAIWKGEQYTISFDINYTGGTNPGDIHPNFGSPVGALPDVSRTGYTFEGWNTQKNGSDEFYTASTIASGNITLYAQWKPKQYKLTYDAQGGSVNPASKDINYGASVGTLPTPSRPHYIFVEWNTLQDGTGDTYKDNALYDTDANTTVYAQWKGEAYKISFDAHGGTVSPGEKTVYYGSETGVLPQPIYPGYEFLGWLTEINTGTKYEETTIYLQTVDITLHASWKAKEYTIDLKGNESNATPSPNFIKVTFDVAVGDELSTVSVTRQHYTLAGWNTKADGTGNSYDKNTIYEVAGNTTLFAQWKGQEYKLSFNVDNAVGATKPDPKPVYYGSPVGELPKDIRPGYAVKWNMAQDGSGTEYTENTTATGDVTLYAQWTPVKYTLTFNPQGGSVNPTSKPVTYDAAVGTLPDAARPGYNFEGWYTAINGGGDKYDNSTVYNKVAGNSTVHANWTGKGYTLSFNTQGGNASPTDKPVTYGSPVGELPSAGSRTYYSFSEWNTQPNGSGTTYTANTPYTIAVGDATLYAIWKGDPYSLNFDANGGTVEPTSKTVYYDAPVGALPVPKRPGYAFTGWNIDINGTGDFYDAATNYTKTVSTTLYAQWVERKYTIEFNANYTGGGSFPPITNITYGSAISSGSTGSFPNPADLTRSRYAFIKWNSSASGDGYNIADANTIYSYDEDITLYAQWLGDECTLQFNPNFPESAVNLPEIKVRYGSPVGNLHDNLSRTGYNLTGWNTSQNGGGKDYYYPTTVYDEATTPTLLFAQWTPINYVLFFEPQGGSVSPASKTVTYDAAVGILSAPTRSGYTFKEWNTKSSGDGIKYTADTVYKIAGNSSLFAQWTANEYTLTFDANGGVLSSLETSRTVKYNSSLTALPAPSRVGYDFAGWNDAKNGLGKPYANGDTYSEAKHTTLYAQWTAKEYKITFDNNGGGKITPSGDKTVTYDQPTGTLPTGVRANYTFDSWNSQPDGNDKTTYYETTSYKEPNDITLYAQWIGDPYTISFDVNGGAETFPPKKVNYGSKIPDLPAPTREGHTFAGWNDEYGATYISGVTEYKVSGNLTLTAQWTPNDYTITYIDPDGGILVPPAKTVKYKTSVELPAIPRAGYTYTWNTEINGFGTSYNPADIITMTENVSLYVQWVPNTYKISFDTQGGSEVISDKQVTYDASIGKLPVTSLTGYTFEWNTQADGNGTTYNDNDIYRVVGDTDLYAKWTIIEYLVTYIDLTGRVVPDPQTLPYNSSLTLPKLLRQGYTYTWNTDKNGFGTSYSPDEKITVTGDINLYVQWVPNTYIISFYTKGGSEVISDRQVTYEASVGKLPVTSLTGYTFKEWNTQEDGNGTTYSDNDIYRVADDIKLYAKWTLNNYTITFRINYSGGVDPQPENFDHNTHVSFPNVARPGHTLKEWTTKADGSGVIYDKNTYVTRNETLFAQWLTNEYTVVFNPQGGDVDESERKVTYDLPTGTLPIPTRTGYSFKGWFTEPDGGVEYFANSIITGDIKLYAQWEPVVYHISFDLNDPSSSVTIENKSVSYGVSIGKLPSVPLLVPSRTGYTLDGWNTKKDGSGYKYEDNEVYQETDNITLYAQWTAETYTISFDAQGGSPASSQPVKYKSATGVLPSSSRTGYTFDGWFTGVNGGGDKYEDNEIYDVADDIKLYAKWTANSYALHFDTGGGSSESDLQVRYEKEIGNSLPVPTFAGHEFKGWFTELDGGGTQYTETTVYRLTDNTTLYAKWTVKQYTIDFDAQGGNVTPSLSAEYKGALTLPSPTRAGYVFKHWNTSKDGSGVAYSGTINYTVDNNITLYAQWEANTYTLDFDEQDGVSVNSKTVKYETSVGELPVTTRTGYKFEGWFTGINGSGVEYFESTVYKTADHTTLYAKWEANVYALEFKSNYTGGIDPANQNVTYEKPVTTTPVITRPGYDFVEWNTAQDGTGTPYAAGTVYLVTGNTVLYAKWKVNSYVISFDANYIGGANPDAQNAVYDDAVGLLPSLTRTGYTFKGWNTAKDGDGTPYSETTVYTAAGNTVLYAQWAVNSYLLSFDVQGGVSIDSHQVFYDAAVGVLPTTSRENYTFGGWFTEINGGTEYTSTTVYTLTGNTVLYAKWVANAYLISFAPQGGSAVSSLPVTYGAVTGVLPESARDGYIFGGWNTDKDGYGIAYTETTTYTANGNLTLYAQWTAISYKLRFDAQNGEIIDEQTVVYDSPVGELPGASRTGYSFEGWFTGIDGNGVRYLENTVYKTAGDITLHAKWVAKAYLISFDANYEGKPDAPIDGRVVAYNSATGAERPLPVPVRKGYKFKEWNTETDGSGTTYVSTTIYTVAGNTTLYAQWTAETYTISFDAQGGASDETERTVTYDSSIGTLPVPTRTGYTFKGWFTEPNGDTKYVDRIYGTADDITLYAQWEIITYTVSFITGNNVDIDSQSVNYGTKATRPSDDPVRDGYVFGGWYKDNEIWNFNTPVTGNIQLTAKWLSSDARLKSLTINHGTLSPEFLSSITDYTVETPYDIATVSIVGIPYDSRARVTGNVEDHSVSVGDNSPVKIVVTAEDGVTTAIYTIRVIRADHIAVSEANLISLTLNGRQVAIEGNKLEHAAGCSETSFALELDASPYASVVVNGSPYVKGQGMPIEGTGETTTVRIHVVSETGVTKDYVLKIYSAIDESRLYYSRWPDILGINANYEYNGHYDVMGVRWFRYDGSPAGNKGYIEMLSSLDYAEIQTAQKEGWRRVCGVPVTRSYAQIKAYPNPVPYGESLQLELPEQLVGSTLNIYDIKGALVKSGLPLPTNVNSIDMSGFGSGIYLLNIVGKDGNHQSVKIIVE
jgi:uncharacterized repeat protein (TIGR02543 family)